jgi:hypothetical protein
MPKNYDSIDLDMSWDGDLILDKSKDLKDTSDDMLLSFQNQIFKRVKSDLKDWRDEPQIGAGLGDFVGETNITEIGKLMEDRIRASLLDIVNSNDLEVRVVPIGPHRVLVNLRVQVLATPANGMRSNEQITVSFIYDYFERGVFVPLEELNKFGGRSI